MILHAFQVFLVTRGGEVFRCANVYSWRRYPNNFEAERNKTIALLKSTDLYHDVLIISRRHRRNDEIPVAPLQANLTVLLLPAFQSFIRRFFGLS